MVNKNIHTLLILVCFFTSIACSKNEKDNILNDEFIHIGINTVVGERTKTTISDLGGKHGFAFEDGDQIGLFARNVLNNIPLTCEEAQTGSFEAYIQVSAAQKTHRDTISYYAYYPYNNQVDALPSSLNGELSHVQAAPYDGTTDYIVATPQISSYDVDPFPSLTFTFSTHLFAIVKLSIINSNEAYENEQLLSIGLKSTNTPLAGQFSFDVSHPEVGARFTEDGNYLFNTLQVTYDEPVSMGNGMTHSVYAIVNPSTYQAGTLSLVVRTQNSTFTLPVKQDISFSREKLTILPVADISSASCGDRVKTIVLWGDSHTDDKYLKEVQAQLGSDWNVIRGGVGGDEAQIVAARQGGLPMFTGETPFTIPASSNEYVYLDEPLYWREGTEGNYTYGRATSWLTFQYYNSPQLNPLIIQGVECEIYCDYQQTTHTIRRLSDGEAVEVPARSPVSTFGSRAYADADIIVVYVGSNGRPADSVLIDIQDRMKAYLTNDKAIMIVAGFLHSPYDRPMLWSQEYVDTMTEHYGQYFIDQRTLGGGVNAIPLMKEIGQINFDSQVSEEDMVWINRGDWPISWFASKTDPHLNQFGARARAILLRRRMAELGLL